MASYYEQTFGRPLPPVAKSDINNAFDHGVEPETVMICIDAAAVVPRPSWAYARAILYRLVAEGVHTTDEYYKRQTRFYDSREADRF